jgi:tetratricopeptide (TPR) repeat protein
MISESHAFRAATLLFDQGRYDLAERQFRLALAEDPNLATAHACLALCLSNREAHTEATSEARHAVGLEPADSFMHYALASVLMRRNMTREAIEAAWEAVGLDPDEVRNWGILAATLAIEKKYKEALSAADRGLAISPDDPVCLNTRAMALVGLGRSKEAAFAIDGTLSRDPDNAATHNTMGWTLLHRGTKADAAKALDHFREALRLDPTIDNAREGLVEALKARYFIYRGMLTYFLFMARIPGRVAWMIILGGVIGNNVLRSLGASYPAIAPFVWPITIAYFIFVVLTWITVPLFNLALSLNRFGRASLRRHQLWWAWGLGAWIGICLLLGAAWLITDSAVFSAVGVLAALLIVPLAMAGLAAEGPPRWIMAAYLAAMSLLMLLSIPLMSMGQFALLLPYIFGCMLSPMALNIVNSFREPVKN